MCWKEKIKKEKKVHAVFREKNVMNLLLQNKCPFFITLLYTFQDESRLYFIMNYARNGELLTYIRPPGVSLTCTTFYAAEIVRALEHLHSLGIVHRYVVASVGHDVSNLLYLQGFEAGEHSSQRQDAYTGH